MRLTCKHCGKTFDIAHRDVLAEAARITGREPGTRRVFTPTVREGGNPVRMADGNTLDPADVEAARLREEAIARRLRAAAGHVRP